MEEKGYIEIRVDNQDNSMLPSDVDISEIKEYISDIESFLYPDRATKSTRPHISYALEKGSAKHRFLLPLTAVLFFNSLVSEIKSRDNIDFLDYKRQMVINKFQKKAKEKGLTIELNNSASKDGGLVINHSSNFETIAPKYYESEFYLYGEIYQEGGKTPNVHITTKEYGNLTVGASKEQIMEGEKKTYRFYGLKVKGKRSLSDDKLSDLQLIEYLQYNPVFNKNKFKEIVKKASVNLSKIDNVDNWINDLRAESV